MKSRLGCCLFVLLIVTCWRVSDSQGLPDGIAPETQDGLSNMQSMYSNWNELYPRLDYGCEIDLSGRDGRQCRFCSHMEVATGPPRGSYSDYVHTGGICALCDGGYRPAGGFLAPHAYGNPTYRGFQYEPGMLIGSSVCEPCASGWWRTRDSSSRYCFKCVPGLVSAVNASECVLCPDGQRAARDDYWDDKFLQERDTSASGCIACGAGEYSDQSTLALTPFECETCAPGSWSRELGGAASCEACEAGTVPQYYQNECLSCPIGKFSAEGDAECTPVRDGYVTVDHNGDCEEGGSETLCLTGTWAADGCECKSCEPGETTFYWPALSSSRCQHVRSGWYEAENIAQQCAVGKYQNLEGQTSCYECDAGKYQSDKGQSSCDLCDAGEYQRDEGQISCDQCLTGEYQINTGQSTCDQCLEGTYQTHKGQDSCIPCPMGKYQTQKGQDSCIDCGAGKYQDQLGQTSEGSCITCPVGTYRSEAGQASCSLLSQLQQDWECIFGWMRELDRCVPCLSGSEFVADVDGKSNTCQQCALGMYKTGEPEDMCKPCEIGTYSAAIGAAECTDCPSGQMTLETASTSKDACTCGGTPRRPVPTPPLLEESRSAVEFYARSGGLGY